MSEVPPTEQPNQRSRNLDRLTAAGVVALMDAEEPRTAAAVSAAAPSIAIAAERVAACMAREGRTVLLGAGTSGRIALSEVAELRPTFGVPEGWFTAWIAGGSGPAAIADSEDDERAAPRALSETGIGDGDVVLGLAASGTTPFVLAGLRAARELGGWACGIANNPGTPVLGAGDHGVLLDTGPEILTGSTRLQAATAQKLALNRITTAAMVLAGRVIGNQMVDVNVTLAKLERRAVRIVEDLGGVDHEQAVAVLEDHGWRIREALNAIGAPTEAPAPIRAVGEGETVELRAGGAGDAAAVRDLALAELGRAPTLARLTEILSRYPSVIAQGRGAIRGFGFGVPLAPDIIDLASLLVTAPSRGRGIGARLIERFEEYARPRYRAIVVANSELWPITDESKRSAVPLYRRLGYRELYGTAHTTILHKELDAGR